MSPVEEDKFGDGPGYAPVGEKYVRVQFIVRGVHHSIIAAAMPFGFICHLVFRDGVDDYKFIEFLDVLDLHLVPSQHGIIDNASVHRTLASRIQLLLT